MPSATSPAPASQQEQLELLARLTTSEPGQALLQARLQAFSLLAWLSPRRTQRVRATISGLSPALRQAPQLAAASPRDLAAQSRPSPNPVPVRERRRASTAG